MRHVPALVDEAAVLRLFRGGPLRRTLRALRAWLRPAATAARGRPLPFAEVVWMPFYLVTIGLRTPAGDTTVTVSVDAYGGSFALFAMQDALRDGSVPGEHFAPRLDEAAAVAAARRSLLQLILRRRSREGKPVPGDNLAVELVWLPFWVYYFERKRGLLDIKVRDAATGGAVGARMKTAVLDAFDSGSRG